MSATLIDIWRETLTKVPNSCFLKTESPALICSFRRSEGMSRELEQSRTVDVEAGLTQQKASIEVTIA